MWISLFCEYTARLEGTLRLPLGTVSGESSPVFASGQTTHSAGHPPCAAGPTGGSAQSTLGVWDLQGRCWDLLEFSGPLWGWAGGQMLRIRSSQRCLSAAGPEPPPVVTMCWPRLDAMTQRFLGDDPWPSQVWWASSPSGLVVSASCAGLTVWNTEFDVDKLTPGRCGQLLPSERQHSLGVESLSALVGTKDQRAYEEIWPFSWGQVFLEHCPHATHSLSVGSSVEPLCAASPWIRTQGAIRVLGFESPALICSAPSSSFCALSCGFVH